MPKFAANISFLFTEVEFLKRFEAARQAGELHALEHERRRAHRGVRVGIVAHRDEPAPELEVVARRVELPDGLGDRAVHLHDFLMRILGVSAFYHDSAAALVVDGRIVAAAQEERFTRRKHDPRFPGHATRACLAQAALAPDDIDLVVFYEKPFLKFERLIETYLANAPQGFQSFRKAIPLWIKDKVYITQDFC